MEWADVEEALPPDVQRVVLGFVRKKHILLQLIRRRLDVLLSSSLIGGTWPIPRDQGNVEDTPGWWGVSLCVNPRQARMGYPFRHISIIRSEDGREGWVYAWQTHGSFKSYLWRQRGDRPWTLAPSIQNSHLAPYGHK